MTSQGKVSRDQRGGGEVARQERTMWCTPSNGLPVAAARAFAAPRHTLKQPYMPGPRVAAIPSRASSVRLASLSARWIATGMFCWCASCACKGWIPPNDSWIADCLMTTFERRRRSLETTAAQVSSAQNGSANDRGLKQRTTHLQSSRDQARRAVEWPLRRSRVFAANLRRDREPARAARLEVACRSARGRSLCTFCSAPTALAGRSVEGREAPPVQADEDAKVKR